MKRIAIVSIVLVACSALGLLLLYGSDSPARQDSIRSRDTAPRVDVTQEQLDRLSAGIQSHFSDFVFQSAMRTELAQGASVAEVLMGSADGESVLHATLSYSDKVSADDLITSIRESSVRESALEPTLLPSGNIAVRDDQTVQQMVTTLGNGLVLNVFVQYVGAEPPGGVAQSSRAVSNAELDSRMTSLRRDLSEPR